MPQTTTARTVLASTALVAAGSGVGASLDLGASSPDDTLRLELVVTAIAGGTPALNVSIETSPDGVTWTAVKAFSAVAVAGRSGVKAFAPVYRYVRASYALTGTGVSATFSVAGVSLHPLANLGDLKRLQWPAAALGSLTDEQLESALGAAEQQATNTLAAARYVPPFTSWDDSLRQDVLDVAAWNLMSGALGFNPEAGGDVAIRQRFTDAQKNLQAANYVNLVDSTPTLDEGEAYVVCGPDRKWAW